MTLLTPKFVSNIEKNTVGHSCKLITTLRIQPRIQNIYIFQPCNTLKKNQMMQLKLILR